MLYCSIGIISKKFLISFGEKNKSREYKPFEISTLNYIIFSFIQYFYTV